MALLRGACGYLRDAAFLSLVLQLVPLAGAQGQNLITNGEFHFGLSGWNTSSASWSSEDHQGLPGSGSLRVDRAGGADICIDGISGSIDYTWGAHAKHTPVAPLDPGIGDATGITIDWWSQPGCNGNHLGGTSRGVHDTGYWTVVGYETAQAPSGAQSASFSMDAFCFGNPPPPFIVGCPAGVEIFFDGIFFSPGSSPVADFTWNPPLVFPGGAVQFSESASGFPVSFAWDFENDGVVDSLDPNPLHAFADAGDYDVRLEVCGHLGCDEALRSVQVEQPTLSITGPPTATSGQQVLMQASAVGCAPDSAAWEWDLGYGGVASSPTSSTTFVSWSFEGVKTVRVSNTACGVVIGTKQVIVGGGGVPVEPVGYQKRLFCGSGVECVSGFHVDKTKPTVILIHGLQQKGGEVSELWTSFSGSRRAGTLLSHLLGSDVNTLQFVWDGAFQVEALPNFKAYKAAHEQVSSAAQWLALKLLSTGFLGPDYDQPIHFVGHSLGVPVAAYAAESFLANAPLVTRAQVTALDQPVHIERLFGYVSEEDEAPYRFPVSLLKDVLKDELSDPSLDLRIDNYYSFGLAGTGDRAIGPVYNHDVRPPPDHVGLQDPGMLDRSVFEELPINNDHSGVHLWYRWTMEPTWSDGKSVCPNGIFDDPTFGNRLPSSLDPCAKGYAWSLSRNHANPDPFSLFPDHNGDFQPPAEVDAVFGASEATGCGTGAGGTLTCTAAAASGPAISGASTSAFSTIALPVPESATTLRFNYRFDNTSDGAGATRVASGVGQPSIVVLIGDVPIWTLDAGAASDGITHTTPPLPLGGLTGQQKLTVALFPSADVDVEARFSGFRFELVAPMNQVDNILYEQSGNEATDGAPSQIFEPLFSEADCAAADDFVVPANAAPWFLGQVTARGDYFNSPDDPAGGGPTPRLSVTIYHDDTGKPGSEACSYEHLQAGLDFVDLAGEFKIVLPEPCLLASGRHWLSVRAEMNLGDRGQWQWLRLTPQTYAPAKWHNPMGGWPICHTWTTASSCFGWPAGQDLSFFLLGPPSCTAPSHLELTGRVINSTERYEACVSIYAGDGFSLVGTSANVTLEARVIELANGFSIGTDAALVIGRR